MTKVSVHVFNVQMCVHKRLIVHVVHLFRSEREVSSLNSTNIQFVNVSSHDSTSLSASTTSDISVNQINANIFKSQRKTITGGWDGAGLQ